MSDVREYLPHEPPALMLQRFEAIVGASRAGLKGHLCLQECGLLWMTAEGLPVAFAVEILGQLSGVFLRSREGGEKLAGGRLATVHRFIPEVACLPPAERLEARIFHLGGSSIGYHKFEGEVLSEGGRCLVRAQFSVVAFAKE